MSIIIKYTEEDFSSFSSYGKLQRVIAYTLRFIQNTLNPETKVQRLLTTTELEQSIERYHEDKNLEKVYTTRKTLVMKQAQ